MVEQLLTTLINQRPTVATILMVIGGLRLFLKPVISFMHWLGKEWKWLEKLVVRIETSKWLGMVEYVLDWMASVKVKKQK
mgnify:FL=1